MGIKQSPDLRAMLALSKLPALSVTITRLLLTAPAVA